MSSEALKDTISIEYGDGKLQGVTLDPVSLLLNKIARNFILTTNYDHVLEKAAGRVGIHGRPTLHGFPQQTYADLIQKQKPLLYKIHGDCAEQSTRVLTTAEYHRAYGVGKEVDPHAPVPQILGPMVHSRSLLFVGCSLGPDRTVQAILQLTQNTIKMTHYALLSEIKDEAKRAEKVKALGQRGIRAIWYPEGQHQYIATILQALMEPTPVTPTFTRLEKNDLIYELAEHYPSALAARDLWKRAGGLVRQMPAQPENATQMWSALLHRIENSRERMILLLEKVQEDGSDTPVSMAYLQKLRS
ncbi:SIR2 family NAD-dependent protein deacylase [Deinococcus cellulosilyticus]|nr:SIR2 family protein [Deinococcus cellulosilyticus]